MISVLVAEDNRFVRDALCALLESAGDMSVVAQCTDGDEVLEAAVHTDPDIVLMDVMMPRLGGLDATQILLAARPASKIIMLTGALSVGSVREAHALGACGFILKGGDPDDLFQAIRTVADGGTAWSRPALAALGTR